MFGDLSFSHILILLLVLVLVFGAKRIPEIGKSIGQGIKEFNRSLKDATSDQPPAPPRNLQPPGTSSSVPTGGDPKRLSASAPPSYAVGRHTSCRRSTIWPCARSSARHCRTRARCPARRTR